MKLRFSEVRQRFHRRDIFGIRALELTGGSFYAVTGQNGSGKSTLIKLAGGLLRPTVGEIRRMDGDETRCDWQDETAMVTPELSFYPRLTARENLVFFLGLRGISVTEERMAEIFREVGLEGMETSSVRTASFSTGMRQRLKLAVLFAAEAKLWLLDEPAANLDGEGKELLLERVRQAKEKGSLILWATNDDGEAQRADAKIHIADGMARLS
ncbi:ABC transporter ATP-binding protein [Selenomonas sp. TAMA-11512]|uniref:ABC transporter ATP-binding protein n=1 Tax=Selenomonas sp. TAMA-11512 TaxID=3095337 RepID=UPI003084D948|nr:ABC transporter ATP-binding protein [Selenomonas sp. TAMA-11512]